ncbi:MAG: CPBP family intramembrane metalloprotease [Cyclobacteriaceae bacterium]|nr:CPBP family intramembrane metalloprotease [Cyclobacteriaceae bacterium]
MKKIILIAELSLFFIGLPMLYRFDFLPGFWKLIPLLLFFSYCLITLTNAKKISVEDLKLKEIKRTNWLKLFFFPFMLFTTLIILSPDNIFADFDNPRVLIAIITYPLLSSLPQEIIYRKFFYFRYSDLIKNKYLLIGLNAILFSIAHIYFQNYIALILTFLGAIAFSFTYLKSRSLIFVSIEHSMYGLALLCSDMNQYFYKAF